MFEIVSTIVMAGAAGSAFYFKNGMGGNDHPKIIKIADNCGLHSKDGKKLRIYRKTKKEGYTEYVYQMPQGMSFKDFETKLDHFQDGLNIKKRELELAWSDLQKINWSNDALKQIRELVGNKKKVRKEVEMQFDGMLRIRVYDEPLTTNYTFDEATAKKINGWKVVIGKERSGNRILFDFEKKYNIIVSGTPGYGKSNWINSTINTLLMNHPEDVTFTLIDLKDGLEFNRYRNLKQVTSFAMTPKDARESLKQAVEKMEDINEYLREKGYSNVKEAGFKERHFIIIDEGADLADDKVCQEYLADIARKGRASGLKLIFATQYPTAEVVKSQIKRQCLGRLSFVLDTATASNVALDQGGAESLPAIEGRALYKDLRLVEVQTPYIDNNTIKKVIEPHINIRPRKESSKRAESSAKGAEGRKHSLVIEET